MYHSHAYQPRADAFIRVYPQATVKWNEIITITYFSFHFQVDKLTASLHQIQDSFKSTRDALSAEVNERQDALKETRLDLEKVQFEHEQNLVKVL